MGPNLGSISNTNLEIDEILYFKSYYMVVFIDTFMRQENP